MCRKKEMSYTARHTIKPVYRKSVTSVEDRPEFYVVPHCPNTPPMLARNPRLYNIPTKSLRKPMKLPNIYHDV